MSWPDKNPNRAAFQMPPDPSNEIGYQITRQENGSSIPCLSFLIRIAKALDARIKLHVVPRV